MKIVSPIGKIEGFGLSEVLGKPRSTPHSADLSHLDPSLAEKNLFPKRNILLPRRSRTLRRFLGWTYKNTMHKCKSTFMDGFQPSFTMCQTNPLLASNSRSCKADDIFESNFPPKYLLQIHFISAPIVCRTSVQTFDGKSERQISQFDNKSCGDKEIQRL